MAESFPDVRWDYLHVDAATIHMVNNPQRFDVIVTDNLFGDILTDLAPAITGGIGLAAVGLDQRGRHRAVDVRTRARLRAGHRRQGDRRSHRRDALRRADAGSPGPRRAAARVESAVHAQ